MTTNNEPIFDDGSDLSMLQELETEDVIFETGQGKKYRFRMSSLVPADLVEARKRMARKQVDSDEQELFLVFLALRKNHPKLKWNGFRKINLKWEMKLIATLYQMNGMDDIFRAINPTARPEDTTELPELDADDGFSEDDLPDI